MTTNEPTKDLALKSLALMLIAACNSQPSEPQPGSAQQPEAAAAPATSDPAPAPAPPKDAEAPAPAPTPAPAPEPTFAEIVAPIVGDTPPTAEDSKTAWTHYKAKNYVEAQRMFARASLFEPDAWKPALNLACASALAKDEAMTKAALREAVAREPDVVPAKARADEDLAAYREAEWFEPILLGKTPGRGGPAASEEGVAYFALSSGCGGIVGLSEGEFVDVNECGTRLDADPSGNVFASYATYDGSITKVFIEPIAPAGEAIPLPPEAKTDLRFEAIGNGQFWGAAGSHVAFYDGKTWRMDSVEGTIKKKSATAAHLLVDKTGALWVASYSEIYRHGPSGYELVPVAGITDLTTFAFSTAANGDAWLSRSSGPPLHLEDGQWQPVAFTLPGHEIAGGPLAVRSDGTLAMWMDKSERLVFRTTAGAVHDFQPADVDMVTAMEADDAGRLWLWTNTGIVVVGSDLRSVERSYPVETIPELRASEPGEHARVGDILVQGTPTLAKADRPHSRVRGVLVRNGKPLAGAEIEMCTDPIDGNLGSFASPCEGADFVRSDETEDDGSFLLSNVKVGLYEIAVRDRDAPHGWVIIEDIDCMDLDSELHLGNLEVPKR
jgi:ligand-binding sensor domain-containing protein